jgi:hypothetical protein
MRKPRLPLLQASMLLSTAMLLTTAPVFAGDDDAALSLADKTQDKTEQASNWRTYVEAAAIEARPAAPGPQIHGNRLSFDVRFDDSFAPGWRVVLADHLDSTRVDGPPGNQEINTLKEAYLSWHVQPNLIADLGRINVRNGVGVGYNPTDYFRTNAVRSIISIDPASLRENRLGSVMFRAQTLWDSGSLTALYSPEIAKEPSTSGLGLDLGATNQSARWQVALSEKFSDKLNPQWLLSGGAGQSPQLGMNLSALANDSTVVYFEWSGGRSAPLATQAAMVAGNEAFRSRAATGLTYTTPNNISISAEYEYNGAGLDRSDWDALQTGSPLIYGRYRGYVANVQDLPTNRGVFTYLMWQDAIIKHLDISALLRYDLVDHSRLQWVETRYHWPKVDVALQWQTDTGRQSTDYGALPDRRLWQAVTRFYF